MREANERKQSRATRTFTYGDETHSQAEWARLLNLSRERVRQLHNANRLESYIKEYRFMRDLKAKKLSPE
jgi:DNA-directed RNA polymerase sigma subunit (sigma70/sigma32)